MQTDKIVSANVMDEKVTQGKKKDGKRKNERKKRVHYKAKLKQNIHSFGPGSAQARPERSESECSLFIDLFILPTYTLHLHQMENEESNKSVNKKLVILLFIES